MTIKEVHTSTVTMAAARPMAGVEVGGVGIARLSVPAADNRAMRAMPWVIGVLGSLWALGAPCAGLPVPVLQALRAAAVPPEAMSVVVVAVPGAATPRLSHLPAVPRNPASVMKLITTYAGLSLLGPDYTWRNRVFVDGNVRNGVLQGDLIFKGSGDCAQVDWTFLGGSIANWSFVCFIAMGVLLLANLLRLRQP